MHRARCKEGIGECDVCMDSMREGGEGGGCKDGKGEGGGCMNGIEKVVDV